MSALFITWMMLVLISFMIRESMQCAYKRKKSDDILENITIPGKNEPCVYWPQGYDIILHVTEL